MLTKVRFPVFILYICYSSFNYWSDHINFKTIIRKFKKNVKNEKFRITIKSKKRGL